MPAVTTPISPPFPRSTETEGPPRPVVSIVTAQETFEGGGFPVHRPFPQAGRRPAGRPIRS